MTADPRRLYPTERDRQIITAVYTHRALSSEHLALLFWGSITANSRCRYRLRLLAQHGYLERAEQPVTLAEGRRPLVYFLDRGGVDVAAQVLSVAPHEIDWKPAYNNVKWLFLDHLLATNDIRVRLEHAAPTAGFRLVEWLDDKTLSALSMKDQVVVIDPAGRRETVSVGPDGYFALSGEGSTLLHRAFIEADRGTVPLTRWGQKVKAYLAYFASPQFRDRYQASKPLRVLTVTTTQERLVHMKQVTEEAGGQSWFWFATYEATRDPDQLLFHPVWHMAGASAPVCFPYPPK